MLPPNAVPTEEDHSMKPQTFLAFAAAVLLVAPAPARAQWTRVPEIPANGVVSLFARGDTALAGTIDALYISTDAGATWRQSKRGAGSAFAIVQTARVRNHRLYVGTGGQGVFTSDDMGLSWQPFNEGLVGGFLDSQLDVADFDFRGDSLVAGTFGAGAWVRSLAPGMNTWHPFGGLFEENQAANVADIAVGGSRVLAAAGGNGSVFRRDPGDAEWTISWLNNVGLAPGVQVTETAFNGHGWVAGTAVGVFRSAAGQEPWARSDPGFGVIHHTAFAVRGRTIFAAFDIDPGAVAIDSSADDGATWQLMDVLPQVFNFRMAMVGNVLYAARLDGLWRRTGGILDVPGDGARGLSFGIVGRQPVGSQVRFAFELPAPASASIALYDVRGRRVGGIAGQALSAGPHQLVLDTGALRPGVYQARLVAGSQVATKRVVRSAGE
jgi:hypothetical protein